MKSNIFGLFVLALAASAQYKLEKAGAAPPAVAAIVAKEGTKIVDGGGKTIGEIWMRSAIPTGAKSTEQALTLPEVAHGTLMGAISFPTTFKDRRGQTIKAGSYTMRYSYYPQNGDHQGVAPQRDFLLLTPLADDTNLEAKPTWDELMVMSRKASGTPHPAVYSFWKEEQDFRPGIAQLGESDWVLYTSAGGSKLAIILVGQADH